MNSDFSNVSLIELLKQFMGYENPIIQEISQFLGSDRSSVMYKFHVYIGFWHKHKTSLSLSWPRNFFIFFSLAVLPLRGSDGVADGHLAASQSQPSTTSNVLSYTPIQNKHLLNLRSVLEKDNTYLLSNRQLSSIPFSVYVFGCACVHLCVHVEKLIKVLNCSWEYCKTRLQHPGKIQLVFALSNFFPKK